MYCKRLSAAAGLCALMAWTACTRSPAPSQPARLAILRFENLGADISDDWMGRAFAEVVTAALAPAPDLYAIPSGRLHSPAAQLGVRPISAPGVSAERDLALAAGANRIGYGRYAVRGGRIEAYLTIEDARTGKILKVVSASAGDLLTAGSAMARQVSSRTEPFATGNQEVVRLWSSAIESGDAGQTTQLLERAIAADPDFGPAYRSLAERKVQQQDADGAATVLQQALARGDRIPAAEHARIEYDLAGVREDSLARQQALERLVTFSAADPVPWGTLGEIAFNRRDFKTSIRAFENFLAREPDSPSSWNQLGYAEAYAGDLTASERALRRYQSIRPADPNPLDSLGDVNLLKGRLREAEAFYLQAAQKTPGFLNHADLYKAAMARLMTGDVSGADGLAKQYTDARAAANDPLVNYYRAGWLWTSGRRAEGYRVLADFAGRAASGPLREVAARAETELAIWSLMLGDRPAAARILDSAVPAGVFVARFLAQPPASAGEWNARATRSFSNPRAAPLRDLALGYALLLDREYAAAAVPLERVYQRSGPASDEHSAVLLAWAWLESGREKDAASLLQNNLIPPATGSGPLFSFAFPRIYYLRGLSAEKARNTSEAAANYRLFLKLSGDRAFAWQEEKHAADVVK